MKRFFVVFCLLCHSLFSLWAQESSSDSPFLFNEYKEGTVFLKNRSQVKAKLNMYLPTGRFVFIDAADDNKQKFLSNLDEIAFIRFGERVFLLSAEGGGMEILSSEPLFYALYRASIRDKGKTVGYGGTSTLGNTRSYSANRSGTGVISDPLELEAGEPYNIYKVGSKQKEIRTMKQFLKLYSKQKEQLQTYINENNIHFDNALQMLELTKYAESLK